MCKSADRGMVIGELALWEKTGGRSGTFRRESTGVDTPGSDVSDTVTNVVES
jgi:cyclic pyranopterin phosphate synthase